MKEARYKNVATFSKSNGEDVVVVLDKLIGEYLIRVYFKNRRQFIPEFIFKTYPEAINKAREIVSDV